MPCHYDIFHILSDEKTYKLKTYVIPDNAGEIITSQVYTMEEQIDFEALSEDNFTFTRWSGDVDSRANPLNFEINSDLDIVAEFTKLLISHLKILTMMV